MKRHLGITLALGAAALAAGCLGTERRPIPHDAAIAGSSVDLNRRPPQVDEAKLEEFGFKLYWDSPIQGEVLTSLTLEGDALYAFTASNRLYQIDIRSGMVRWAFDVGRPLSFADGRPIAEWVYRAREDKETRLRVKQYDEIFFCAQGYLYALDKHNGSELWSVQLPFTPSSPPEASATHVFVGSWDDRLYAIRKDSPLVPDWSWRTGDDVMARPLFYPPMIFASSIDGGLYAFEAPTGKPKPTFPFMTDRRLDVDPAVYKHLLYLPSDDFNLYVVGPTDGLVHHRECPGAPIDTRPIGIADTIYFGAEGKGIHALARRGLPNRSEGNPRKVTHELLWRSEGTTQLLCKGMEDVYLLAPGEPGTLKAAIRRVHAAKGNERGSLELSGVDFWLTNPADPAGVEPTEIRRGGILLLGFRNGWIVALKERATIPGA